MSTVNPAVSLRASAPQPAWTLFTGRKTPLPAEPVNWTIAATGTSVEGRPIPLYVSEPGQKIDTLYIGRMHGNEDASETLAWEFMKTATTRDLKGKRVGIIPCANPDGAHADTRANARGVDLNRNFPVNWQPWDPVKDPQRKYYPGDAPESEPETRFIRSVVDTYQPAKIVSGHQPFSENNFNGPARYMANRMRKHNGYPVKGSVKDYKYARVKGSFGIYAGDHLNIPTVTVELPPRKEVKPEDIRRNVHALMAAVHYTPREGRRLSVVG